MTAYVGCRVRLHTEEGEFCGSVFYLEPNTRRLTLDDVVLLPSGKKVQGIRHFFGDEIDSLEVVGESDSDGAAQSVKKSSEKNMETGVPYQLIPEGSTLPGVTVITATDDAFQDMVAELWEEGIFGMAIFGAGYERFGKLSLLLIRTQQKTYLIDALLAAPAIFVEGLATVLESNEVLKVIHDCRWASDLLYHQFSVKLTNVFDTQVADVLVNKHRNGDLPQAVPSLPDCLLAHHGEDFQQVCTMNQLETAIQVDGWIERPLKNELIDFALESVKHLLTLRRSLLRKLFAEFNVAVDVYLSTERNALQTGKAVTKGKVKHLPASFRDWHYRLPALLEAEQNKLADRLDDSGTALPADNLPKKKAMHHQAQSDEGVKRRVQLRGVGKDDMSSSTDSALSSQGGENEESQGLILRQAELRGAASRGSQQSLRDRLSPGETDLQRKELREETMVGVHQPSKEHKSPSGAGQVRVEHEDRGFRLREEPFKERLSPGGGHPDGNAQNSTSPVMNGHNLHHGINDLAQDTCHSQRDNRTDETTPINGTHNNGNISSSDGDSDSKVLSPRGSGNLVVCFGRGKPKPKTPFPLRPKSTSPLQPKTTSPLGVNTTPPPQHGSPPAVGSGMKLSDEIRWQRGRGRGEPVEREPYRNERFIEEATNGPYGLRGARASMDFPTAEEMKDMEEKRFRERRSQRDYSD